MDAGKRIAADDWTDQDLLTKDEARERLGEEIDSESAALAALGADPRVRAEVQLRQRRLSALKAARSHL
jgi:hypothetical protein